MGYDRPILTERGPIEWDAACGDCDWHHSGTERRIPALAYHHAAGQHHGVIPTTIRTIYYDGATTQGDTDA